MFEDLNAALNCDASNPPAQGLTLIKCAAPTGEGSLLMHHFLSLYLQVPLLCDGGKHNQHAVEKEIGLLAVVMCSDHVYSTMCRGKICARLHMQAGHAVCLCGFEQDLAHYATVTKRMGLSLAAEAKAVSPFWALNVERACACVRSAALFLSASLPLPLFLFPSLPLFLSSSLPLFLSSSLPLVLSSSFPLFLSSSLPLSLAVSLSHNTPLTLTDMHSLFRSLCVNRVDSSSSTASHNPTPPFLPTPAGERGQTHTRRCSSQRAPAAHKKPALGVVHTTCQRSSFLFTRIRLSDNPLLSF